MLILSRFGKNVYMEIGKQARVLERGGLSRMEERSGDAKRKEGSAVMMIDCELGQRVFNPPVVAAE
jgi:hypothetical protein